MVITKRIMSVVAVVWFLYNMVQLLDERLKRWALSTPSDIDEILVPLIGKSLRVFIVIDFAFPSRTVYAAGDGKRLLKLMLAGDQADVPAAPES